MRTATAFFSDGLDLIAQFLACSQPADGGIAASFANPAELHAAAAMLRQWSDGDIMVTEAALRITVSETVWNTLYAGALSAGRPVRPDRIGLSTRGAGGMLAELSMAPALLALALRPLHAHPGQADRPGRPAWATEAGPAWTLMRWEPLEALLLRNQLLAPEARLARQVFDAPPRAGQLDETSQRHGFLLRLPGSETVLACPAGWRARTLGELRSHFNLSVLLLFRLMFFGADQGWGWEADSAQCAGLVALMDHAASAGLADFGEFRESCNALSQALNGAQPEHVDNMPALMASALRRLVALWPHAYLRLDHPARALFAGWMTQVDPGAQVAPDVMMEPGARICQGCLVQAGVVLGADAVVGPFVILPAGVVVAAGARVSRLGLGQGELPPGTVLHGSADIHRGASIQRQVVLGADVEICAGVTIPDGVQVCAGARVRELRLGIGAWLPAGTRIEGSLLVGRDARIGSRVRLGDQVRIGSGAVIGDDVRLPSGMVVADGARIGRCAIARTARVASGTVIHGDLVMKSNAEAGAGVVFGAGVMISRGVALPGWVVVEPGAHIDMLWLGGCTLPRHTRLGGNLVLETACQVGRGVRFGGDNHIGAGITLPAGLRIARGAEIRKLKLHGAQLPHGTVVCGDLELSAGTRIGRGVTLEANVLVANGAAIPDGITVSQGAVVRRCNVEGAQLGRGIRISGDLSLRPGVRVGDGVRFDNDVVIDCACAIPDGMVFMPAAWVRHFHIGAGVVVPPGVQVAGDLHLEGGVTMEAGVFFNAGAMVQGDLHIPAGARIGGQACIRRLEIAPDAQLPRHFTLYGDVSIGAGARIGNRAILGADVKIGPGVMLPPDVLVDPGARLTRLFIADDVILPPNTRLGGDLVLRRGVHVSRDVAFGAGVDVGPHVVVPRGAAVAAGACLRVLRIAAGVELPPCTRIGGDLVLCAGVKVESDACFGAGVRVEADCRIGQGVIVPAGVVIEAGSHVKWLDIAPDVSLPPGTRISGDLYIGPGVRVGGDTCFCHGVEIGDNVRLPDSVLVADDARIERLTIAEDAVTGKGLILCGNAVIEAGAHLDDEVLLGADVLVGAGVHLPAGAVLNDHAQVRALCLGHDIQLPSEFELDGDLCLGDRVVVGAGVCFGAGVVVGADVVIGSGVVMEANVVIGSGAVIGDAAVLEDGAVVESGAQVPAHARIAAARAPVQPGAMEQQGAPELAASPATMPQLSPPPSDAPFSSWQAYLSTQAPPSAPDMQQPDDSRAPAFPQSEPMAIPQTHRRSLFRAGYGSPF